MNINDFVPVNNICIIEPVREKEQVVGMTLTDANKEQPIEGKVIALSPYFDIAEVKVGMTVIFKKYAPREFIIDDVMYLAAESEDIIAVIKNND